MKEYKGYQIPETIDEVYSINNVNGNGLMIPHVTCKSIDGTSCDIKLPITLEYLCQIPADEVSSTISEFAKGAIDKLVQ